MRGGDLAGQHPVAALEIAAAENDPRQLLLGPQHSAQGQRAFGREQVAVGPADFRARAFAGAIAEFARNGARRGGFQRNLDIDGAGLRPLDRFGTHRRDEPGLDDRAAQIVERGFVIKIAG